MWAKAYVLKLTLSVKRLYYLRKWTPRRIVSVENCQTERCRCRSNGNCTALKQSKTRRPQFWTLNELLITHNPDSRTHLSGRWRSRDEVPWWQTQKRNLRGCYKQNLLGWNHWWFFTSPRSRLLGTFRRKPDPVYKVLEAIISPFNMAERKRNGFLLARLYRCRR